MQQIGDIPIRLRELGPRSHNPFFAPVADVAHLESYIDSLRKSGDSCGARIRVTASRVPVGLGEPLFDKLDADIAYAMMGINAVKGVEIGAGFASVTQRGTTHGDSPTPRGFRTNNAGGVLGGISTGQDLEVSIAIKPTSSILSPRETIDLQGRGDAGRHQGTARPLCRHPCDAHCRGHAGPGGDGARAAPAGAERRRAATDRPDRCVWCLTRWYRAMTGTGLRLPAV